MTDLLRDWRVTILVVAAFCTTARGVSAAEPPDRGIQIHRDETSVTVSAGGKRLLVYRFGNVPMKPYAGEFSTPAGVQVLRDAPADHKHHHGLMLALAIDGVDFWSENANCGRQLHRGLKEVKSSAAGAQFTETLDWMAPGADRPLATERRSIRLNMSAGVPASLLTWESRLAPASGRESITLGGSHYFGLGMRFVASMDKAGHFFNPDGKAGEAVRGRERLTPAGWMAYTASVEGKPVTVAMLDAPTNPRHPARFFTMPAPFAYLSATLNLWKEPLEVPATRPLVLRYGVALCDGLVPAAELEKLYRRWAAGLHRGQTGKGGPRG